MQRELLLQDLWAFEQNEKEEEKIRESMERQFRKRVETRLALDQQMLEQFVRKQQELVDEKQFREEQMKLLAERDRIDQLSNEKRHRKMMEHRKEIHEILEERKARRVQELADSVRLYELQQKEKERHQQIVEEERVKMLKEHAEVLLGYLPPGILRESDREHLPIQPKHRI